MKVLIYDDLVKSFENAKKLLKEAHKERAPILGDVWCDMLDSLIKCLDSKCVDVDINLEVKS